MTVNQVRSSFLEHNLYSEKECEEILKFKVKVSNTKYSVRLDNDFIKDGSSMKSQDLIPNSENSWIFDKMKDFVESKFPVKWIESPHGVFREYSQGDFFVEHTDHVEWKVGTKKDVRLFAISIQLTPESNYTGGELVIERNTTAGKQPGDIVLFGSNVIHEVKTITDGSRDSLIFFVSSNHIKFTNTEII